MSGRSLISRRDRLHTEDFEKHTFAEAYSEPPRDAEGEPYIGRFPDTENSEVGKANLHTGLLLINKLPWPAVFP